MSEINIDSNANLIMVNIYLWNKRLKKFENMLITLDTGATMTVISKDILYNLGYDLDDKKKARVITASNVEYVNIVNLDRVMIGNHILENEQVYAHTFPESSYTLGVLGLNVLRNFDIEILFSRNKLVLKKIENKDD